MTRPAELTREEAAVYAGVGIRTIDRWIRRDGLTAYKIRPQGTGGSSVRIPLAALDAFLAPQPIERRP